MNKKSDGEIKEHVLRELKWDSRTTWSEIGVEVFEGVVTLTGPSTATPRNEPRKKLLTA